MLTGLTQADAQRDLRTMLHDVEDGLREFLTAEHTRRAAPDPRGRIPVEAVTRLVEAGGKRVRPLFCLSGYLAAGGRPAPEPVRAAIALELLHTSALIHDDVMDDSDLRRCLVTTHVTHAATHTANGWRGESRRYGEAVAILAGDLAWAYADHFMVGLPAAAASEWFELRAELVVGQLLDVAAAAEFVPDPELARHIAVVKSGRYTIHRPLVLGALLADRADCPELAAAFAEYGEALGEAFQLRDDLIDAFGTGEGSGKPAGLDFDQNKMTMLLALAMQQDSHARSLVEEGRFDRLRERMLTQGVCEQVEAHIGSLVARAQKALADAPLETAWREHLGVMARQVAYRDR